MASLILFFLLVLSIALTLSVHCSGGGGFSIDLIHRDSPNSPYHNPSLSRSDRLRAAARRSVARANRFRTSTISATPAPAPAPASAPIESVIIPDTLSVEYLMTVSIGTPPLEVIAIADTGSDLIWTQCQPCAECFKQKLPIYDPKNSSSYATVSCNANICSEVQGSCTNTSLCEYEYTYGSGATAGILSLETLTFDSDGKRHVRIPKIMFGCSHESEGAFTSNDGGIVGLGGGPLSLVSQLGSSIDHKFSYCLVPHSDLSSSSLLNFGERADVIGPDVASTPMIDADPVTFYYISLEDISVGDDKVIGTGNKKIIIDSGTTYTILDDSTLQALVDKLTQVVKYPTVLDSDFNLCFNVSSVTDLELPEITFQFSGAALKLSLMNAFFELEEGVVCLAIVSNGDDGSFQIFGNVAQQNWHIGYDLRARKVTFASAYCANL